MKIITIASLKGGVGKTTLAAFLAQSLSYAGHRVLAVDLDHNNNLTDYFLRDESPDELERRNIYHVLSRKKTIVESVFPTSFNLDILPATLCLARAGIEFSTDPGVVLRFPSALRKTDYDFVILDTPPALNLELSISLVAADIVLSPVAWSRWTIQGYQLLADETAKAVESTGREATIYAVPSIVTDIEAVKLRSMPLWTATTQQITKNAVVKNAGTAGKALRTSTKAWEEFAALAREIAL